MIPISEYLVPNVSPTAPADAQRVRQSLVRGLPHRIVLERDLALLLVVGTGLATAWRDAPPDALVGASAPEARPQSPHEPRAIGALERPLARLLLVRGQAPLAAIPLALGLHRATPDHGGDGPDERTRIALWVLGWDIRAGNLRGPGDVGGFIDVAWRVADRASATFSQPAVHPAVAERNPDLAWRSELG